MSDNRQFQQGCRDMVCIDTYRVLDSCRDKDCFEDVRVFLTCYGQELVDRGAAVRAKCARIVWSYIDIDSVPFNRGFYQLTIKMYVRIICEACISPGNVQDIEGIAVVEKKVILFGSEGNVSVFKSETGCSGFCPSKDRNGCSMSSNLPIAVLETVDPIILSSKIVEPERRCCCCCCCGDIPEGVVAAVNGGDLTDGALSGNGSGRSGDKLVVTLGFFSVVRIERPAQYLINAVEYSVPEKECVEAKDDDPCHMFKCMAFPINEFSPPSVGSLVQQSDCDNSPKRCGCS